MKIVSTTLVGPAGLKDLPEALASVRGVVDASIVIWTGPNDRIEDWSVPAEQVNCGQPLPVRHWPWRDDFAAARNEALRLAEQDGARWVITLDSDERIESRGEDIRAFLTTCDGPVVSMRASDGSYAKPRAIRLPCSARWRGPTHEAISLQGPEFARARFSELPKSEEQLRAKAERDVRLLTEFAAKHPKEARWWYYLGDQLQVLDRKADAIAAFDRCAGLSKWDEEAAFSRFRAAILAMDVEGWRATYDRCLAGLDAHPWSDELAWFAAFAAYQGGWHLEAARLATMPRPPCRKRDGFRMLKASYEGPADVARFAFRELGMVAASNEANKLYEQRLAERQALLT